MFLMCVEDKMPNVSRFGNQMNNVSSSSKSGAAGKAAGAAAGKAAAGASSAGSKGPVEKAGDTVTLSGVISQAGNASGTISIPQDSAGPLPKTQHTDALSKAANNPILKDRPQGTCKNMSESLWTDFENMFKSKSDTTKLPKAM
jgi:hypothetical protein